MFELKTPGVLSGQGVAKTMTCPAVGIRSLPYFERSSSGWKHLKSLAWISRFEQYLLTPVRGSLGMTLPSGHLAIPEIRSSSRENMKIFQGELHLGREEDCWRSRDMAARDGLAAGSTSFVLLSMKHCFAWVGL